MRVIVHIQVLFVPQVGCCCHVTLNHGPMVLCRFLVQVVVSYQAHTGDVDRTRSLHSKKKGVQEVKDGNNESG
jgi:hypothetical protein